MNLGMHHTLRTVWHVLTRMMRENEDALMCEVEDATVDVAFTLVGIGAFDVRHFHFVSDFGLHGIDATG